MKHGVQKWIKVLLTMGGVLFFLPLRAQHLYLFSSTDSSAVPFASVMLKQDGVDERYFESDENGNVRLENISLQKTCAIRITSLGYVNYTATLFLSGNDSIFLQQFDYTIEDVVITGQASPVRKEVSVYEVKVITRAEIEQTGSIHLQDILQYQPGVALAEDPVLGSSLQLNGIGGENIKILVNGIPMIGRQDGNIDLSQINLNDVERIEIIEGPMSVKYGTNALGGVINIITRQTLSEKGKLAFSSQYETDGKYNADITTVFPLSSQLQVSLSGGRNYFDGWKRDEEFHLLPVSLPADTGRTYDWKPREQYFTALSVEGSAKKMSYGIRPAWFDETITNRGYPREPYFETAFDEYYHTTRFDNSAFANVMLKRSRIENEISYNYYSRVKNTYYKDLTTLGEILTSGAETQDTSVFTLWHGKSVFSGGRNTKFTYETGVDINVETAYGKRIEDLEKSIGDYAVFASVYYEPVKGLVVSPAARYAYNTEYTAPVTPSLHLRYQKEGLVMRVSAASGFRSPTLKEMYFYFVDINHNIIGNEQLKAETAANINFSASKRFVKNNFSTVPALSLYYNDIHDLITLAQVNGSMYSYVNIGRYQTTGFSTEIPLNWKQVSWHSAFHLTAARNNAYADEGFLLTPSADISARYQIEDIDLTLGFYYSWNGRENGFALDAEGNVTNTYIAAYQIADITCSKLFFKKQLTATLGCKNLWNVTYLDAYAAGGTHSDNLYSAVVGTGRNIFLQLKYQIGFKNEKM